MSAHELVERLRHCMYRAPEIRDVRGFEGIYAVTEEGRVWTHPRSWTTGNYGNITHVRPGRWLKLLRASNGYLTVKLMKGGRPKSMQVHRLVALAFLPNPMNLPAVNHRNSRRSDNRVANLEWSSHGDNKRHAASAARHRGRWAFLHRNLTADNDT